MEEALRATYVGRVCKGNLLSSQLEGCPTWKLIRMHLYSSHFLDQKLRNSHIDIPEQSQVWSIVQNFYIWQSYVQNDSSTNKLGRHSLVMPCSIIALSDSCSSPAVTWMMDLMVRSPSQFSRLSSVLRTCPPSSSEVHFEWPEIELVTSMYFLKGYIEIRCILIC